MQKSTEPSLTTPAAGEAQCAPANRAHSESRSSARPSIVPVNFVEISLIPKPDSPDKQPENEEQELDDETGDKASSPGEEQMTGEVPHREQEEKITKKEPLRSEIILEATRKAFSRGDFQEAGDLTYKFSA